MKKRPVNGKLLCLSTTCWIKPTFDQLIWKLVEPDMEPTGHIVLSRCILGTSVRSLPITSIDKDLGLEKRTSVRFFASETLDRH